MLSAIIIDDEQTGINALKLLIESNCQGIKILAESTEPEVGIDLVERYKPNVLFLDINMPRINAFQLYERLVYKNFKLVFTTAHPEYALKAVRIKPHDYLLKPIDAGELIKCVQSLSGKEDDSSQNLSEERIVDLAVKNGIIFIRPREIVRLEASGSYTTFYMFNGQRHTVSKTLKDCEALLNTLFFYRCHNSHLVNLRMVERIITTDGLFARMSDGSIVPIAQKNKEELLERLKAIA